MWNWSEVYLSIIGGVIAGLGLVLVELIWRLSYGLFQKHKAIRAMSAFFSKWEETINTSEAIDDPATGVSASKEQVRFLHHQYNLRILPIEFSRWGKHIPEQQYEDIKQAIARHEHAEVGIIHPGKFPTSPEFYPRFFDRVRDAGLNW